MEWTLIIVAWWGIMGSAPITTTEIPMWSQSSCTVAAKGMRDKFRQSNMYCVDGASGAVIPIE